MADVTIDRYGKNQRTRFLSFFPLILLIALLVPPSLQAQNSEEEEHENDSVRFRLEGYGEMVLQHFDFGPDRKSGANGAPDDSRTTIDIPRAVFEMAYYFKPDLYLEAELEIEHAGTGGAMELEFEEFGEYEQEFEKGGEITLEEIHVTKEFSDAFALRVGRLILPIGPTNRDHEPDEFFTAVRPEGEGEIIPLVWNELGLQLFGRLGSLDWQFFLVNGLDATGFSSEHWIQGGHQGKFEVTRATDPAVAARVDLEPIDELRIGGAFYIGNSTDNRPKKDMEGIDGIVTILEADAVYEGNNLIARASFLDGSLSNAPEISSKNNRLSRNLTVPRTPVASGARAWSVEAGYDILSFIGSTQRLLPFLRYEYYNGMERTEGNTVADLRFRRNVITAGVNYFPTDGVVIKLDVSHRTLGLDRYNDENTISLGLAYMGEFLEL